MSVPNCNKNLCKKVTFDDTIYIYETYSSKEYDRSMIDSLYYRKCLQRVPDQKWRNILLQLNIYKSNYMIIHKSNIAQIMLHKSKSS
jgi:hypothetical protein